MINNFKLISIVPIKADYEIEIDICTLESFVNSTPAINLAYDEAEIQAVFDKLKEDDELCIDNLSLDEKEILQITLENYIEYQQRSFSTVFDLKNLTNIEFTSCDIVDTTHLDCSEYEKVK